MAVLRWLKRLLNHPWCEFAVGLILVLTGAAALWASLRDRLPVSGLTPPHAVLLLGATIVLRSLPGLFLGVEFIDEASPCLKGRNNWLLRALDKIARSHAMDLFTGGILVVAGVADLLDNLAQGRTLFRLNADWGVIAFGLAPFLNALVALFKGLWRIDRERALLPTAALWGLLDRAVQNPCITFTAGVIMVASGLAEAGATLTEDLFVTRNLKLVHSLILFGTYGILNALPEVFLGLRFMLKGVLPTQEMGDPEG
jgi:hypothetical protein